MIRRLARAAWWPVLVCLLGHVPSVAAQSLASRTSVTVLGGFATGGQHNGVLAGLEIRSPEFGRLSAAVGGSVWGFIGVGCDVQTGPRCPGESAKAFDVGPVVRLSQRAQPWRLEATLRLGGLWYTGGDDGVWNPSVGLGCGFGQLRRVGGLIGVRYHAVLGSGPSSIYRGTADRVVLSAGIQVRF